MAGQDGNAEVQPDYELPTRWRAQNPGQTKGQVNSNVPPLPSEESLVPPTFLRNAWKKLKELAKPGR